MLFSKACFRKLHLENSLQIQKQNPFPLKLYNKTWHCFHQRKIPEAGTEGKRLDLAEIEAVKRQSGLRVLVGDLLLNLVFKQSSKMLNSVRSQHIHYFLLIFLRISTAKYFYSLMPPLLILDLTFLSSLLVTLPTLGWFGLTQNQNKRIIFNFLQNIPRFFLS